MSDDVQPYTEEELARIGVVMEGSCLAPDDEYVWVSETVGRAQATVFGRMLQTLREDRRKLATAVEELRKIERASALVFAQAHAMQALSKLTSTPPL